MNSIVFLTQNSTFIIGDIAKIFGIIMDTIYNLFHSIGIESLGFSIIAFTIIVRILMLPLAFKQQKSMKEMQVIQPEIKKIQDKYKKKKDTESQQKMQMEINKLYQEHGVNPLGGCLPVLVQFPIMISLFQVLRNIPAYIGSVKLQFTNIATAVVSQEGANDFFQGIIEKREGFENFKVLVKDFDLTNTDKIIDVLSQFSSENWLMFTDNFHAIKDVIGPSREVILDMYNFAGLNLADAPDLMSFAILLPVLNVLVQFMSSKASMSSSGQEVNQQQKSMMYTMPLITAFFVATMPAGLGLYWLVGGLFQWGQQLVINSHLHGDEKNKKDKIEKKIK